MNEMQRPDEILKELDVYWEIEVQFVNRLAIVRTNHSLNNHTKEKLLKSFAETSQITTLEYQVGSFVFQEHKK